MGNLNRAVKSKTVLPSVSFFSTADAKNWIASPLVILRRGVLLSTELSRFSCSEVSVLLSAAEEVVVVIVETVVAASLDVVDVVVAFVRSEDTEGGLAFDDSA